MCSRRGSCCSRKAWEGPLHESVSRMSVVDSGETYRVGLFGFGWRHGVCVCGVRVVEVRKSRSNLKAKDRWKRGNVRSDNLDNPDKMGGSLLVKIPVSVTSSEEPCTSNGSEENQL